MSPQQEIFNSSIDRFGAEQEDIRTAAAFAAGRNSFHGCTTPRLMPQILRQHHRRQSTPFPSCNSEDDRKRPCQAPSVPACTEGGKCSAVFLVSISSNDVGRLLRTVRTVNLKVSQTSSGYHFSRILKILRRSPVTSLRLASVSWL